MEITITTPVEGTSLIRLAGKFTIEDINMFKDKMSALVQEPVTTILLSFTDVDYVDSSGIGSLILLMNAAKNHGINLVVYNLQDEIKNVFKISHLDKYFKIATSDELRNSYPGIQL